MAPGMGAARIFSAGTGFQKFSKIFWRKLRKMLYFSIFFKKLLTNHALLFRAFGWKMQIVWKFWENFENLWRKFYWKIEFLIIFGKFLTKNRALGNNTIFQQQLFRFRGGGFHHFPPLATPLAHGNYFLCNLCYFSIPSFNYSSNIFQQKIMKEFSLKR